MKKLAAILANPLVPRSLPFHTSHRGMLQISLVFAKFWQYMPKKEMNKDEKRSWSLWSSIGSASTSGEKNEEEGHFVPAKQWDAAGRIQMFHFLRFVWDIRRDMAVFLMKDKHIL